MEEKWALISDSRALRWVWFRLQRSKVDHPQHCTSRFKPSQPFKIPNNSHPFCGIIWASEWGGYWSPLKKVGWHVDPMTGSKNCSDENCC